MEDSSTFGSSCTVESHEVLPQLPGFRSNVHKSGSKKQSLKYIEGQRYLLEPPGSDNMMGSAKMSSSNSATSLTLSRGRPGEPAPTKPAFRYVLNSAQACARTSGLARTWRLSVPPARESDLFDRIPRRLRSSVSSAISRRPCTSRSSRTTAFARYDGVSESVLRVAEAAVAAVKRGANRGRVNGAPAALAGPTLGCGGGAVAVCGVREDAARAPCFVAARAGCRDGRLVSHTTGCDRIGMRGIPRRRRPDASIARRSPRSPHRDISSSSSLPRRRRSRSTITSRTTRCRSSSASRRTRACRRATS